MCFYYCIIRIVSCVGIFCKVFRDECYVGIFEIRYLFFYGGERVRGVFGYSIVFYVVLK